MWMLTLERAELSMWCTTSLMPWLDDSCAICRWISSLSMSKTSHSRSDQEVTRPLHLICYDGRSTWLKRGSHAPRPQCGGDFKEREEFSAACPALRHMLFVWRSSPPQINGAIEAHQCFNKQLNPLHGGLRNAASPEPCWPELPVSTSHNREVGFASQTFKFEKAPSCPCLIMLWQIKQH